MQSNLIAAVITTGKRKYFIDTIRSLKASGFDDLTIVYDFEELGAFPTWYRALTRLFVKDSFAQRYVIFEDDLIVSKKQLKQFLEQTDIRDDSYYNLYCCDENTQDGVTGWIEAACFGRGAVGLMFGNRFAEMLLTSSSVLNHFKTERRHRNTDGVINCFAHKNGVKELVHCPTLVEHVGEVSAIGH